MNEASNSKRVHKLREEVVRQISAGEVITRPVNCVKELIENSLDAKSTSIQITVKNGGLDLIKVKDDGVGISKNDLQIVCERYTTSKLETFDDLSSICSYGFRGEALYSMSSVGILSITTRTNEDDTGSTVQYMNGVPLSSIKPIAANRGTIISIEQLFHTNPLRRNNCEKANVEYGLIADLVTKYAIHCSNSVSFSLRKDEKHCDINTSLGSQTMSNISSLYGNDIGKHLIAVCCDINEPCSVTMTGVISKPSFAVKKFEFILFINDRLVECKDLKKTIQNVYSFFLSQGFHPFVYLSIKIASNLVDVNVHPSKNEVKYLHEDEINSLIANTIEEKLKSSSNSSSVGTSLNNFTSVRTPPSVKSVSRELPKEDTGSVRKTAKILRTDSKNRTIDEILSQKSIFDESGENKGWKEIELVSVSRLRKKVEISMDPELRKLLNDSEFIGCCNKRVFLIQHGEKLLSVDCYKLSEQLFYQLYLKFFGNFGSIRFDTKICIEELSNIYFQKYSGNAEKSLSSKNVKRLLTEKRDMLSDYFAIEVDAEGRLFGLPIILDGHLPDFNMLPDFIYRLANHVNWDEEQLCFHTLGLALASFYSRNLTDNECTSDWKRMVEYVIYPKAKQCLQPSSSLRSSFSETTDLNVLYRVFERC
ncbi:DNA mismatch repair protein Mlh1-like protein [Leptotrombidium deliense]|uniref:DNA mismatch repair protein Mlh1-like protein n=1 Tax=Leptotrombidium deliense TaxID=299467 RepID=A0A443SVX0_9ACAR|nr:DNA mismatch repair protein Mlh1-like protein [Leptotrombidium deliense]